jgi:uncharacterized heparinase superfamily protein
MASRYKERSTRNHSTVELGNFNSTDVWSGFRVGRRAHPINLEINASGGEQVAISCGHDGYSWLPGSPIHFRKWVFHDEGIEVIDEIESFNYDYTAKARYIIHPECSIKKTGFNAWTITNPAGYSVVLSSNCRNQFLDVSTYSSSFGISVDTKALVLIFEKGTCKLSVKWAMNI